MKNVIVSKFEDITLTESYISPFVKVNEDVIFPVFRVDLTSGSFVNGDWRRVDGLLKFNGVGKITITIYEQKDDITRASFDHAVINKIYKDSTIELNKFAFEGTLMMPRVFTDWVIYAKDFEFIASDYSFEL